MRNTNIIMFIFEIIVLVLGTLIVLKSISMKKDKKVPAFFISQYELKKIKNEEGIASDLFPYSIGFGIICLAFGVEGIIDELVDLPTLVDTGAVVLFLAAWFWFSFSLRRLKLKYSRL